MRTTVDLPEELLRQIKAVAADRGISTNGLIVELMRVGLGGPPSAVRTQFGKNSPVPVTLPATGQVISQLTNAEIFEMLDREDDRDYGRLA